MPMEKEELTAAEPETASAEENQTQVTPRTAAPETESEPVKLTKKQQFFQLLKFTAFSLSAGIIQFLLQSTLFDWTHALTYWQAYPIALTASVIWNFTFNRKFTFKAANNVPIAMVLVVIYNLLIVVPFAILGEYLVGIWGDAFGMLVTVILLLINFVTEFFWDKFVVFNGKFTAKLEKLFRRKKA
ncbi:MAG: GtrA family protein [Muribaculaceae bacterium]|nr:GtrA family protein [Muribaculaceae bacterium]